MGGKSRKTGQISKKLIDRIKKTTQKKEEIKTVQIIKNSKTSLFGEYSE
jgi:hypothetical protein